MADDLIPNDKSFVELANIVLNSPKRHAVTRNDLFAVDGGFDDPEEFVERIRVVANGAELAELTPVRRDGHATYTGEIDVSSLSCRIALEILGVPRKGAGTLLHDLVVWRPACAPARPTAVVARNDKPGQGPPPGAPFTPLQTFTAALKASQRLSLRLRDGRAEEVAAHRMVPAGEDWGLVVEGTGGFRTILLREVESIEALVDRPLAPLDVDARAALKAHVQALPPPRATLASDRLASFGVALPDVGLRPPPAQVERIVLIRPGAFATDELYVLAPLAPLAVSLGVGIEIVSPDDEEASDEAARRMPLDENTVVVVSRRCGDAWRARLLGESRPFVVYLIDDDPLAAIDTEGLPHRYRRGMIELVATDFTALLRRCDRLLVSSENLAATFASRKTVLMEPPYIRPAPSLAHLEDGSAPRIVYHATDVHRDDLEFIAPAIERTLKDRPAARFELISGLAAPKRLAKLSNFERLKPMGWAEYCAYVAERPAHVSLAPMLGTPFNAAKSIVKLLDAASLGSVGVFSRVAPYAACVADGRDGVLVDNDPPAWRRALIELIDDPERLRRLALGCQEAAKARKLEAATAVWRRLLASG